MDTLGRQGSITNSGILNPYQYAMIYVGPTIPVGKILNFVHNLDSDLYKHIDLGFGSFNYQRQPLRGAKRP